LRRWWVKKYSLPPSHDAYRKLTFGELLQDFYEDLMDRRRELENDLEHADGKQRWAIQDAIKAISKTLGDEVESADPLIDRWEAQIAAGETPDFGE
jgi:phosphodiesterase/alkaline phosphatase D-like protein